MADLAYSIASSVLEKLGSLAYEKISSAWGMKDDLKKLETTTRILKSILLDAEKKQQHNEELRFWLTQLKEVFYDAQVLLDKFECEVLRSQVVKKYGSLNRKVRRFFSRSNSLAFHFSIAHQIKDIRQKLDKIFTEMEKFKLVSIELSLEQTYLMHNTREMTHSYVKASDVIGRYTDKVEIIGLLRRNYHIWHDHISDDNISVIPIVGIGGLGKTTLAKSVYNDRNVVGQFDLRIWVCVSLDFNVRKLIREILRSATNTERDLSNLSIDQLQTSLRETLKDKRFLLVLDDVWNEDRSKWIELRDFITVGAEGSKIIVTTRSTKVASVMNNTPPHQLEGLSESDSLSLFFKCAFGDEQQAEQNPELKAIGKEIVKKCGGVPLALKTLGCLLYSKTEVEWKFVRDNEIWELERDQGDILPALRLSYDTMSASLKQCFAYCSIFPEDGDMPCFQLIRMWMALGFLQSPNDKMELEDFGKLQSEELCARSFFQRDSYNEDELVDTYKFNVHDLIHNLACSVTQHECSIIDSHSGRISDCVRHLRIFPDENNLIMLQRLRKLQSIHVDYTNNLEHDTVQSFLATCISRFKHLRVFDIKDLSLEVLPSSFGTLKHLRYLDLSNNTMKKLPDSICKLQSLETLLLERCWELEELPRDIKNMVSLRTLIVSTKQTYFPENGIRRLESLRFLKLSGCRNLRSLPHDFRYCTTLRTLLIFNCKELDLASRPSNEVIRLSLQTLMVNYLQKMTAFPSWLQGAAQTLQNLWIEKCPILTELPSCLPNLTSLRKLVIMGCPALSSFPTAGRPSLTSLKHLNIQDCDALNIRCKCWLEQCTYNVRNGQ